MPTAPSPRSGFFVYQGSTSGLGWMPASSDVDNVDEYLGPSGAATVATTIATARRSGRSRRRKSRSPTAPPAAWRSGPSPSIVASRADRPRGRRALGERAAHGRAREGAHAIWLRTKARNFASFRDMLELHTNSSNNAVYADADGNIAYFHANFVPRRDLASTGLARRRQRSRPVAGSARHRRSPTR